MKIHENAKIQYCHFFNNALPCPYEEIGCMFRHAEAPSCRYQTCCTRKLCPYKHKTEESEYDEKSIIDEESDNEEEIDFEKCDEAENGEGIDLHPLVNDAITKEAEKESENSEWKKVKDTKQQQKFYCNSCLFCSTCEKELNDHVTRRSHERRP